MTVQSFSSPNGNKIAVIDPGSDSRSLNLCCTIDRLINLSTTLIFPDPSWKIETHPLDQTNCTLVVKAKYLVELQANNIFRICKKCDLPAEGEGIALCRNFKHLVSSKQFDPEELDLSGLMLDCLPFHLGLCKNIRVLDLSNNSLRVLSKGLLYLERLKVINLTGNPIVELPAWVKAWVQEKGITVLIEEEKTDKENWERRDSEEYPGLKKRYKADLYATQIQDNELALINN